MSARAFGLAGLAGLLVACQSSREKSALFLKDRVEKLAPLSAWKSLHCKVKSQVSGVQQGKYRLAFKDEAPLLDDWQVNYDWQARSSRCELHVSPLTPMTANQKTFVEESFCTLLQVFWVHSPFDDLRVSPDDLVDQENDLFIRQKDDSDVGLYLNKQDVRIETKTTHKGTFIAKYSQQPAGWLPSEIRHETPAFSIIVKDFVWPSSNDVHTPPKSFWIYVSELSTSPVAHSGVEVTECK